MTRINAIVADGRLIVSQAELEALGLKVGDVVTVTFVDPVAPSGDQSTRAVPPLSEMAGMLKLPAHHPGQKGDVEAFVRAGIEETLSQRLGGRLHPSADGT